MSRLVHAGSLIARLDTAARFVNKYGVTQDGYPTGPVEATTQLPNCDTVDVMDDDFLVIPTTVTVAGVSFTVISGRLGVEVAS